MAVLPFSSHLLYWVALDFTTSDPADIARMNRFYDETHVPEVLARNPGFVSSHRYSLHTPDERGDLGAGYLAAYELDREQAALDFVARETGAAGIPASYSSDTPLWPELLATRWRVVYERIAQTSEQAGVPGAISIIGIDPPSGANGAELAAFEDFYTNVHLPENTAAGGFTRGVRYQVRHELKHPRPGCPRYLAVYELEHGTDAAILAARSKLAAAAYTQGPPSWRGHTTQWRLWYRTVTFRAWEPSHDRTTARPIG